MSLLSFVSIDIRIVTPSEAELLGKIQLAWRTWGVALVIIPTLFGGFDTKPWSRLDQRRNAYLVFNDSVLEKALFVKELSRFCFLLYCFEKYNTLLFDFFPSCSGRHTSGKGGEQAENPVLVRCLALASPCAILQKPDHRSLSWTNSIALHLTHRSWEGAPASAGCAYPYR